jgi:hypothetical protein
MSEPIQSVRFGWESHNRVWRSIAKRAESGVQFEGHVAGVISSFDVRRARAYLARHVEAIGLT